MQKEIAQHQSYKIWSQFISNKIKLAQTSTITQVNKEMLTLYWEIGNSIIEQQRQNSWGSKVVELLATDLAKSFPSNSGFSIRNLKYMKAFAEAYPHFPVLQVPLSQSENEFVQVPLAQITWYHHISLLTKVKDIAERAFYIAETTKNGWSRNMMLLQIQSKLYQREGKALNNFKHTLPDYQSDLAKNLFKDPYNFDLLFYHTLLHAYVVVELKAGEFLPEYISKLNFYISAVDDNLKTSIDEPTIGLLLCASKSNVKVEYAMRGLTKPLGVASYELEQLIKTNIDALDNQ